MDLTKRNPASRVSLPKVTPRDISDFGHESIRIVTEAVRGTEFETIAHFALMTGSRRGEIAALRWQDVDLKRGRFSIRKSAAILDGAQIYKSPKSLRSRRTEALPPSVVILLKTQRFEQARRRDFLGLPLPDRDTIVFDREDGEPWNVNELSRRWSRFIKKNNLPPMRFHDLRHAFASMSHDAGESMHDISSALGHSSIAVTSAIYIHTFDENKSRRAERLDAHFGLSIRDNSVTIEERKTTKHA